MQAARWLLLAVPALLSACDDSTPRANTDARIDTPDDGGADDGGALPTCDFTEADNATINGTSEQTGKTLGARLTICGHFNLGQPNESSPYRDWDSYKFTISADADVLVHLLGDISTLDETNILIQDENHNWVAWTGGEGDHVTLAAHLTAGEHTVWVDARNSVDLPAAAAYQLTIVPDMPTSRCPKLASGGYAEAGDGGENNGNDVIDFVIDYFKPAGWSELSERADAPEATGLTAESGMQYRLVGSSADVIPNSRYPSYYKDPDTFEFTTGATTTQVSIRLNWPSTTTDYDFRVYIPSTSGEPLALNRVMTPDFDNAHTSSSEDEFDTLAVKPDTTYWLWIAPRRTSTGQPSAYAATLCGEVFSP